MALPVVFIHYTLKYSEKKSMSSWGKVCNFLSGPSFWSLPAFLSWQMSWVILCRLCPRNSSWERAPVSYPGSPNKSASENNSMQKCGIHGPLQNCMKKNHYLPSLNKLKYSWLILQLLRYSKIFLHFIVVKSLKETDDYLGYLLPHQYPMIFTTNNRVSSKRFLRGQQQY